MLFKNLAFAMAAVLSTHVYAQDSTTGKTTDGSTVEEVIILGNRKALYTEITENAEKLVEMPGALGDPLGAISALPGVIIPVGQGGGEPAVRGSSPNDNKYYIDGIPAGYIFHQFNTSIFDENVIQDFQLFSAGFGAQYSGATGAVFDVRLRDPKNQDLKTTINASLLRAGVFVESGVTQNSALYLSARTGLIQFFITEDDEADDEGIRIIDPPEDNDYQFKYTWDVNSKNSLSLLIAGATDYVAAELTDVAGFIQENPDFAGDALLKDSFGSQGLTWKSTMDSGADSTLSIAKYNDKEHLEFGDGYFIDKLLDNTIIRGSLNIPLGKNHKLSVGGEYNDYEYDYRARMVLFVCTEDFSVTCQDGRGEVLDSNEILPVKDSTAFIMDHWQLTDTLNVETGYQWNHNNFTDESFYNPRIAFLWQAWKKVAITSSAGRYNRLPDAEQISSSIGNPNLKSLVAEHFTLGLKGEVGTDWDWVIEAYHKNLSQLPLASSDDSNSAERYSNNVEGVAQGFDLFINRNLADKWYGWVSLSYSRSERSNIKTGETRNYFLDTPFVLNVVGNYQFSEKWNAGFRLSAKSGQAITEIIGIEPNENFPDYYSAVYDTANPYGERLPTYIDLNFRVKRTIEWFGNEGSFFIDVLNALNRQNIVSRDLDYAKVNETQELHIKSEASMGIFPSIGLSFSF